MKEAIKYAVDRMKKDGYMVDELVSRRIFGYMVDYIASELKEGRKVQLIGLGVFKREVKEPRKFYSAMLKKEVTTRPKNVLKFSPSERFLERFNDEVQ